MSNYYRIFIQKESDGAPVVDTIADFGLYCSEIPFRLAVKAKEPSSNNWNDEDGLDEYIPADGVRLEAYEMEVEFSFKGDKFSANTHLEKFLKYVTGKDGSGGLMKMYCEYTGIGRRGIRFSELKDDAKLVRSEDGDILVFKVVFKVNDPITSVSPISGADGSITSLG